MKTKALFTVLSRKWRDGEVVLVDNFGLEAKAKTKLAALAVGKIAKSADKERMAYRRGNRLLVGTPDNNISINRSFRNLKSVLVRPVAELNPVDVLNYRYLLLTEPEQSFPILASRNKK